MKNKVIENKINEIVDKILSEEISTKVNKAVSKVNEKWEGDVKVKKTGEHAKKTIAQLEKELKGLKDKSKKLQDAGKEVPKSHKEQESEIIFAIRAKKDWPKGKGSLKEDNTKVEQLARRIMSSPKFNNIISTEDPNDYSDEFEYADNIIVRVLNDYFDEDIYDDLVEYIKDNYSEYMFDEYRNSVPDEFEDDEDFDELEENYKIAKERKTKRMENNEELKGGQKKLDVAEPKGKLTAADFKKLRDDKKDDGKKRTPAGFEHGEIVSGEMEEDYMSDRYLGFNRDGEDEFYDERDTRYQGDFDFDYDEEEFDDYATFSSKVGKNSWFDDDDRAEMFFNKYRDKYGPLKFRKRKSMDAMTESKKTVRLSESEMIELIERLVIEQKKQDSIKITDKNLKDSKKENDESTKETSKKMKEYTKNMGISYEADNKEFPRGNTKMDIEDMGKIKKDSDKKKAYKASDAVEEYIDQIARAGGMENLDYDQIKPNEEWLELNIEGSSKTGNSQDYANAIPTDVNKKVNERRKKNILAMLKKQSYQKAPQSVYDVAGENTHVEKMLGIGESTDEKKQTKINEDIDKMKNLFNYSKNTQ